MDASSTGAGPVLGDRYEKPGGKVSGRIGDSGGGNQVQRVDVELQGAPHLLPVFL
jgi:hypothetical protein